MMTVVVMTMMMMTMTMTIDDDDGDGDDDGVDDADDGVFFTMGRGHSCRKLGLVMYLIRRVPRGETRSIS